MNDTADDCNHALELKPGTRVVHTFGLSVTADCSFRIERRNEVRVSVGAPDLCNAPRCLGKASFSEAYQLLHISRPPLLIITFSTLMA